MKLQLISIVLIIALQIDARGIQGEWRCMAMNIDGDPVDEAATKKMRLVIERKTFIQRAAGKELLKLNYELLGNGVIRFDVPDSDVKTYFLGRYELEAGKLRVAFPGPLVVGKPPAPPPDFGTGDGRTVSSWER